jgi:hypothetical protein
VGSTVNFSLTQSNISGALGAARASASNVHRVFAAVSVDRFTPADGAPGAASGDQQAAEVGATYAQTAPISGVPLTIVGVVYRVPFGMTFIGADNGGMYDAGTRSVNWFISGGLLPGVSVTLHYTARLDVPGNWANTACVGALDASANQTSDCVTVTIADDAPTPTPTVGSPIVSAGPTLSPALTPTPVMPAARPTLTTMEEDVLHAAIALVEERYAHPPQVPVQLPPRPEPGR